MNQRGVVGEVGVAASERTLEFGTVPDLLNKRGTWKNSIFQMLMQAFFDTLMEAGVVGHYRFIEF